MAYAPDRLQRLLQTSQEEREKLEEDIRKKKAELLEGDMKYLEGLVTPAKPDLLAVNLLLYKLRMECAGNPCLQGLELKALDIVQKFGANWDRRISLEDLGNMLPIERYFCRVYAISRGYDDAIGRKISTAINPFRRIGGI